tara:strand:- start:2834 stop:3067 length:234 start_codon:yes stop_codon:yes gene_type:complete
MANYVIIETSTNTVVNTCVWDGDTNVWQPPTGHYAILEEQGSLIGFIYNSEGVGIGTTVGDSTYKWRPSDITEPPPP